MKSTPSRHSVRRTLAGSATLLACSALVLGLSACAPGSTGDGKLKTDSTNTSMVDWRQDLDDCLQEAGFDVGGSGSGGMSESVDTSRFDMDAFTLAYATCSKEVGEPPVDENAPTQDEMFEAQLAFASCMRDAGYDFPDPVKGGMSPAFDAGTDPKVVDACSAKAEEAAKCPPP